MVSLNNLFGSNLQNDSEKYNDYKDLYRLQCKSISTNKKSIDEIVEKKNLELYNIIYPVIRMPYMFSDHPNKSFKNQYAYLKRRHSYLWTNIHQQPIHTLILAQHNRLGKLSKIHLLPKEMYRMIQGYFVSYTFDDIIRCIAIASNMSFYHFSDF
jgi:hypothetical protein